MSQDEQQKPDKITRLLQELRDYLNHEPALMDDPVQKERYRQALLARIAEIIGEEG